MLGFRLSKLGAAVRSGTGSSGPTPLFSRPYSTTASLGASPTFARGSNATFDDHESVIRTVQNNCARFEGARFGYNLATALTTHSITVKSGREYQVCIAGDNLAQVACSNAFTGTIIADGSNRISFASGTPKTATTTTLTLTVTGTLTQIQVEDVTGASNQAPSEWIDFSTTHGAVCNATQFFTTENGNSVDGSGVVTEATGAAISGIELLMEPAATNRCLWSEAFDAVSWNTDNSGAVNPVVTANFGASPDGQTTADRIVFDKTGGTFSRIQQGGGLVTLPSGVYTFSVWLKNNSAGTANVGIRINAVSINCAVTTSWERFSVSLASAGTVATAQIMLFDGISGNDETADILAWGAQVESGSGTTSHIKTEAVTASRSADTLSYSGAWTADNETRAVEIGTDVDVDDWDGVVDSTLDSDADGILKLSSITVYTTGERQA